MKIDPKTIYALDFDGVICDSAVETGITGWKAATQVWDDLTGTLPDGAFLDAFRQVRPALETGYEAMLIMRLLSHGVSSEDLLENYAGLLQSVVHDNNLNIEDIKVLFGQIRDGWIKQDIQEWVSMNPLFAGVTEKLNKLSSTCEWFVITTKQERFVHEILAANSIELATEHIFGLDRKMSKSTVLMQLKQTCSGQDICFVEDRLPTLDAIIQHPELSDIQLYLANWGYNTSQDRDAASNKPIRVIGLDQFLA